MPKDFIKAIMATFVVVVFMLAAVYTALYIGPIVIVGFIVYGFYSYFSEDEK